MNGLQKVIKGFAIALAALILLVIGSAVVGALTFAGAIVWGDRFEGPGEMGVVWEKDEAMQTITKLEISTGATKLQFFEASEGEKVRVETDSKYITSWQSGGTLHVVEKSHGVFGWGTGGEVQVYVREDAKFEDVKINTGAGTLSIENLETEGLKLELGAGKTIINNLVVRREAKIDGGAGVIEVRNGRLSNLDMELGAGKAAVRAMVSGNSKIDTGVGKLELDLLGDKDAYKITVDKGIGSVTVDGSKLTDGSIYGQGESLVRVESGVGAVEIRMVEER